MLDVTLLGTGGVRPLPDRFLTSLLVKYRGREILIDCGEGTQTAMRKYKKSLQEIDLICLTHFHGDHILGLPGLLMSMGLEGREKTLTVAGPKGVGEIVSLFRQLGPVLFPVRFIEVHDWQEFYREDCLSITAFSALHSTVCFGYRFDVSRSPKFDRERAEALQIPLKYWNRLQHGETVAADDKIYYPEDVLGGPRRGIRLSYYTDSRPTEHITAMVEGSDLLIGEAMYPDDREKARERGHSSGTETAVLAKNAGVRELWLTHYSPSFVNPWECAEQLRSIFADTVLPSDGMEKTLRFSE